MQKIREGMERFFNTAGPNRPEVEYTLDPLKRLDLEEILALIAQGKYFVLHAPRQTGKTSCMLTFLQRIVNGGGYIDREYGLGRKRTDLLIRKPLTAGYGGPVQRIVLELKIKRYSLERTIDEGLQQTADYMDAVGSVDEGHFIIFDRSKEKSWDERIWHKPYEWNGRATMVWGM